jgi:general secretion pathway protein C
MVSNLHSRWAVAGATFALWALVAAGAVYWGLKLTGRSAATTAPVAARTPAPADPAAVARLLGSSPQAATAPVASVASRFTLVGVVASRGDNATALIAVDGKPPKPFRVGGAVDEGLVVQAVETRRVILAASAGSSTAVTLELPRPGAAAAQSTPSVTAAPR